MMNISDERHPVRVGVSDAFFHALAIYNGSYIRFTEYCVLSLKWRCVLAFIHVLSQCRVCVWYYSRIPCSGPQSKECAIWICHCLVSTSKLVWPSLKPWSVLTLHTVTCVSVYIPLHFRLYNGTVMHGVLRCCTIQWLQLWVVPKP